MTTITPETVERIARLARLRFTPNELAEFTGQFTQIVSYVEQLNEVDTDGVEPLEAIYDTVAPPREDEPGPPLSSAEALSNAPRRVETFFAVPKVLGGEGSGA